MKKRFYTSVLLSTMLLATTLYAENNTAVKIEKISVNYVQNTQIAAKGITQAKGLIGEIKPALMLAMKKDKTGIEGTVMCSEAAQKMTANYNKTLPDGSKVRRTALKYRNPKNKPDATDLVVMEHIVSDGNFSKPTVVDMGKSFRIYKALPTHKPCLICHGNKEKMPAKMKEILAKKYPTDLAIGFKEHDFRGVIISEIKK